MRLRSNIIVISRREQWHAVDRHVAAPDRGQNLPKLGADERPADEGQERLRIVKAGSPAIVGTNVMSSPNQVTCTFDLSQASQGVWDIEMDDGGSKSAKLSGNLSLTPLDSLLPAIVADIAKERGIRSVGGGGCSPAKPVSASKIAVL
jgi:hypothetical protein